ncbi:AAA family ATPase [Paenibacillus macerans]|uniref:AAA family ATPase n=1 Tax=Paenibacillus macerans TaxID=44252 RepID=UPI000EB8161A|nr:AAA family ATPase [Paenibacillus macerans]GBK62900.1 GTPase subunit of restriction endonuclease [Paenibacillus macerans]GBK69212.1 GTPase subunit of restriction endonuclease [Paenibacillus macerans]
MEDQAKLRKKEYTDWLRRKKKADGQPYSENTITSYVSALTTAPAKLNGIELTTANVFEIASADQYREMRIAMEQAENFDEINIKAGNKAFQYSLEYYEEFLRAAENGWSSEAAATMEADLAANGAEGAAIASEQHRLLDKNIILYGPPGTGKTYHTVLYAVSMIENKPLNVVLEEAETDGYDQIKARYEAYKAKGQIAFTTFHQSYGYEEFIEGIKPQMASGGKTATDSGNGEVAYDIVPGVFKKFCEEAQKPIVQAGNDYGIGEEPTIWKVSLGGSRENPIKRDCFNNNRIRIGWDSYGEILSEETDYRHGGEAILSRFIDEMKKGDIVLVLHDEETIDAIGVVTGEYEWLEDMAEYKRSRKVNWLVKDIRENILELNGNKVMTIGSVYRLNRITLSHVLAILGKQKDNHVHSVVQKNNNNYVFIIDEINRGNISKIFGELITLIEPSKRIGMPEEIRLDLPYSQEPFGIPNNVYLLATMNTADRSIARLDTALRRRFSFAEMMPEPGRLGSIEVDGNLLNLATMLETMNWRIEALYDREHTIGHAYFLSLYEEPTLGKLGHLFEHTIIPLLQEYFYENYEKIRIVLGDNNKPKPEQFIVVNKVDMKELFGKLDEVDLEESITYEINRDAFRQLGAYLKIYDYNNLD